MCSGEKNWTTKVMGQVVMTSASLPLAHLIRNYNSTPPKGTPSGFKGFIRPKRVENLGRPPLGGYYCNPLCEGLRTTCW